MKSKEKNINRQISMIGNNNGTILKEPEARQAAFKDFCRHLAEGYPIKAWSFRQEPYRCSWATMLRYIKENPSEFDTFLKEEAEANSYKKWFGKGVNLSDGNVKGNPSPQTWATIMRNMFGWDKEEKDPIYRHESDMDKVLKKWEEKDGSKPETNRQSESLECKD